MLPTSYSLVYSRQRGWVEAETKDLACKKQGAREGGSEGTEWNRSPEHWEWGGRGREQGRNGWKASLPAHTAQGGVWLPDNTICNLIKLNSLVWKCLKHGLGTEAVLIPFLGTVRDRSEYQHHWEIWEGWGVGWTLSWSLLYIRLCMSLS